MTITRTARRRTAITAALLLGTSPSFSSLSAQTGAPAAGGTTERIRIVNVAQPVIDQFIASDRAKWGQDSAVVLLLPHGYEGQGPEHSSARLERFLQLCADGNMRVAYPSTPAQYFHALRRQIHRKFRKPAVLMMPKALLRYEPSSSRIEEFSDGTFQLVIDDASVRDPQRARRVILCSGKVYYTLLAAQQKQDEKTRARFINLRRMQRDVERRADVEVGHRIGERYRPGHVGRFAVTASSQQTSEPAHHVAESDAGGEQVA